MDIILTFAGLIAGISLFLYFINALDSGKRALAQKTRMNERGEASLQGPSLNTGNTRVSGTAASLQSGAVYSLSDELKDQLPQRRCPLCSSTLSRDEPLYATTIETASEKKILIYGCPYCHKGYSKSEKRDSA